MSGRGVVTTVTIQADGLLPGDIVQLPGVAVQVPWWRRRAHTGRSWHRVSWAVPGDADGLPVVMVKAEGRAASDGEARDGVTCTLNAWDLVTVQVVDREHEVRWPVGPEDLEARVAARREFSDRS